MAASRRTPSAHRVPLALAVLLAVLAGNREADAQVPANVEILDGQGSALVRNGGRTDMDVEVALWESDETGEQVALVRPASANVWPATFRLQPGETQTVRFLLDPDAYPPGTLLRLETRFIPLEGEPVDVERGGSTPAGAVARLRLVTRILSKVRVR